MITLIFIIGIELFTMACMANDDKKHAFRYWLYDTDMDEVFGVIGGILAGFTFIIGIFLCISVSTGGVLDEKIAMYEEENAVIESQIETVVSQYMDYEQNTFDKCSAESMITLVDLYPELKTDTLVSKQIEVYLKNNDKIKDLKEKQINQKVYRWWLYFGGK